MTERSNIPISENFVDRAWVNYDAYESVTREHFKYQNHVDIRTFTTDSDEEWTAGEEGFQESLNRYPALIWKVEGSTAETISATPEHAIDLLTGFQPYDHIILSLPGLPAKLLGFANTIYLELTSNPEGIFSVASENARVAFNESEVALAEGDCQFLVQREAFEQADINLGAITAVRFRIGIAPEQRVNYVIEPIFKYVGEGSEPQFWGESGEGTFKGGAPKVAKSPAGAGWGEELADFVRIEKLKHGGHGGVGIYGSTVTAGNTYSAAAYIYPSTLPAKTCVRVALAWWIKGKVEAHNYGSKVSTLDVSGRSEITEMAPVGAEAVSVFVEVENENTVGEATVEFYLGKTQLTEGPNVPAWFDGDTLGYEWENFPGESKSISPGVFLFNYVKDPSFEYDTVGSAPAWWIKTENSETEFTEYKEIAVSEHTEGEWHPPAGKKSLFIKFKIHSHKRGELTGPTGKGGIPVKERTKYSAAANFFLVKGSLQENFVTINWYDISGSFLSQSEGGTTFNIKVKERSTLVATAPAKAAYATVGVAFQNGAVGSETTECYVDAIQFTESEVTPEYFDGDTPGYRWAGTPGDSLSELAPEELTLQGLRLVRAPHNGELGWETSTVDYDNWNHRLVKPVPINGNDLDGPDFVQSTLWRSASLPGSNDPMPIDAEIGVLFNTGSLANNNEITLLFREENQIFQTQLDLIGKTQAELDSKPQPDLGTTEFQSRNVGSFDKKTMEEMEDLQTMEDLERTPVINPTEESWVYFTLNWGGEGEKLIISSTSVEGYFWPFTEQLMGLETNTNYLLIVTLEGTTGRVRVFRVEELEDGVAYIEQTPLFDSTVINDDGLFRRRSGRFGWQVKLGDADSYISSIRSRKLNYAEYLSAPLRSLTPVDGVSLYANFTPNTELWDHGFEITPADAKGIRVTRDTHRSLSEEGSFRVVTNGTEKNIGITTIPIEFTDFEQMEIHFSLWFEGSARSEQNTLVTVPGLFLGEETFLGEKPYPEIFPSEERKEGAFVVETNMIAQLVSEEGFSYVLTMPELEPGQWQTVRLNVPNEVILPTGSYRFQILQTTEHQYAWWVDKVSIFQRTVQWSARSTVSDPWGGNYAPWTDFRNVINLNKRGIQLAPRGKELQVRARALTQNASIEKPQLIPRYASLGRLVWPEENRTGLVDPTAHFTISEPEPYNHAPIIFTDTSAVGSGPIVEREWDFGDGYRLVGNSTTVEHAYVKAGTYYITLVVSDRFGNQNSLTNTLHISKP